MALNNVNEKSLGRVQELSVFFPVYNEEDNLRSTVEEASKVLKSLGLKNYEIILVLDGPKDRSPEIAEELVKKDGHIRLIKHNPNKGYGEALKSGFYNSKYPWITFTDSDGQFDFSEITDFIEKQDTTDADLVIGYYLSRQVPALTKVTTKVWELLVFILFGLRVRDIDCGFKLISKKVIETIPRLESQRGAFITSELLIKAQKSGFKIIETGVHHYSRKAGQGTGRNINVIIKSFIDLFNLWQKMR